jgi:hypothetical protein
MMPDGKKRETYPRRHVLARLTDLRTALMAVKPAVAEDIQAKIDALVKTIQPGITAAQDKELGELNLAGAILTMANALQREAAPAEAPADNDENAALFETGG